MTQHPHTIEVDYNARTRDGHVLARIPMSVELTVGDPVIVYEPSDGTECDALAACAVGSLTLTDGTGRRFVHLAVDWGSIRDIHVCTTPCDADCDAYCHEGHQEPWKREPGHPCPCVIDGVQVGDYP